MPEWLEPIDPSSDAMTVADYALRLIWALLFGGGVALIYRHSHGREQEDSHIFCTTLILLSALIAMVTIVIGGSVAKAFSLVGALSIVRFRTVVEDTRDTAFVIFSVIVGMAVGSGFLLLPMIGVAAVGSTAILLRVFKPGLPNDARSMELTVRFGLGRHSQESLQPTLAAYFNSARLRSAVTAKQGAALDCVFDVKLKPPDSIDAVVAQIAQLEGIQSVALRQHERM